MRHITGNNCRADFAGFEWAFLFVDRPDDCPFFVRHGWQTDRARDVVLGVFGRGTHVDHGVKTVCH